MSDHIDVVGAREHNLKGVDIRIPRDALVVITGLSGSGKSSLAFDTIYQEGQRRFMESLSPYARQFLGKMDKPRVERVDGLSPTLSIDQKTVNRNPRSTVGTVTEILDHLRLLLARLGTPRCPVCFEAIRATSPSQVAESLLEEHPDARLHVMAPIVQDRKGEYRKELTKALRDGWLRARIDGQVVNLEDEPVTLARYEKHTIELVMDRLRLRPDDLPRLVEAIEGANAMTAGTVSFLIQPDGQEEPEWRLVSTDRSCPRHGISIPEMEPRLFSFNAPQGMCTACSGIGWTEDFDLDLLLDTDAPALDLLRVLDGDDRLPFSSLCRPVLKEVCKKLGISLKTPFRDLPADQQDALLNGAAVSYKVVTEREGRSSTTTRSWSGILPTVEQVWRFTSLQRLRDYRRRLPCPDCQGERLNPIARAVHFRDQGISALTAMTVEDARRFFEGVQLGPTENRIGAPILKELRGRLGFLQEVGLGYLSLDRSSATLSGGEAQRIRLASQVGSGLQGVTYVLDEPSIGLHGRDQERLLQALLQLRDQGNSVLVVEHDTTTMTRADYLVEVGPGAGRLGGHIVAAGPPATFLKSDALTARYLRGDLRIRMPALRRSGNGQHLVLRGARAHNLHGVDLDLALGTLTVITGVSGSGKSTLISQTLHPALARALHGATDLPGEHDQMDGVDGIDKVIRIDQQPIGRTPRSNPATYTGAFDTIRDLFTLVPESRLRGYKKGRFSFNVKGGRCEECEGAGVRTVEMQFLSDVEVPCESCEGARFNPETLEILYRGKTIRDVLEMSIGEAARFFHTHRKLRRIFETLVDVGLSYVSLGQPSTTLSGGEAQRIKLATELCKPATGRTLYILDEPTTGLHMADIERLLAAMQRLVDAGNTVLVIEHNTDVIKVADHIVDLGPEGGVGGGHIIGQGSPEAIAALDTPTGRVMAEVLAQEAAWDLREAGSQGLQIADNGPPAYAARRRPKARPTQRQIVLTGVSTHNLKNIDIRLPQGKLSVITGPSGSGKTSLAFDTLFAEGQRRYVESLSTYARRFLGRMGKAPVDKVEGLAPAIAIDQRNRGSNPRSTVATVTELYDSLRLLYARIGRPHCPRCARELKAWSPSAGARHLAAEAQGTGWLVTTPPPGTLCIDLQREGFSRLLGQSGEIGLEERIAAEGPEATTDGAELVLDRINPQNTPLERISEAIAVAYGWGSGRCRFQPRKGGQALVLTRGAHCPDHGVIHPQELTPRHFSFNSHIGACPACQGLGQRNDVDPSLLLPQPKLPLDQAIDARVGAVLFRSPRKRTLVEAVFKKYAVAPDTPVLLWPGRLRKALLQGLDEPLDIAYTRTWGRSRSRIEETQTWPGIIGLIDGWSGKHDWLRRETTCSRCEGGRLRPEILAVTLGDAAPAEPGQPAGTSIQQACALTVAEALRFWDSLCLGPADRQIAEQAVQELTGRLHFLDDVGLGYLSLDRVADTLSGGEAQRIRLATQLGSRLTGTIYVLDEPTVGLHPRDTDRLMGTLTRLRDLGNTLVVVEHDPDVMRAADWLVDMGPGAGEHGGRIVDQGTPAALARGAGLTGSFLSGRRQIPVPDQPRPPQAWLAPPPASLHNLRDVRVRLPRARLSVVTGVSGSGKSSLIMEHVAPWLEIEAAAAQKSSRGKDHAPGTSAAPQRVVVVDQKPIGRSPRSTPATYCDLLGPLRDLFAQTPLARERGWAAGRFSWNTDGGRCPHCEGRGAVLVEMHFLSDVWMPCEPCRGRRFDRTTLEVRWKGLSIADVLDLPVDEALALFSSQRKLKAKLQALSDVGLGYLRLGQSATTLSGGEAQRLKLAKELVGRQKETAYLLDEPTTGLHLADIDRLLQVLHRLVDQGHTIIVIEHQIDMIRNADWVIDMGPEGGDAGGQVLAEGPPAALLQVVGSHTGAALRKAAAISAAGPAGPPPTA